MIPHHLPKPHHHGDLRNALVQAGIALLAEGGTDALTLRKCAARAGLSHAAPAHHFDGLTGLKAAIAHEGLGLFRKSMLTAAQASDQSARGRLKGICRGYLDFALENRAPFVAPGTDPQVIETQVWSLIHGFTAPSLSGRFRRDAAAPADPFDQVLALLDNLAANPGQ